jgi:isopentenyl phosphate kinase
MDRKIEDNERKYFLVNMDTSVIEELLDQNMVPVLYGVPTVNRSQGSSILSGDAIAPFLTKKFDVNVILHATCENGVYRRDKSVISKITKDNYLEIARYLQISNSTDVTDGMKGKVKEIFNAARDGKKIKAVIFNGKKKGNISSALKGKKIEGTFIENL